MAARTAHVYERDYVPPVPPAVTGLRVLLLVAAVVSLLTVGAFVASSGGGLAETVGQATWALAPAAIGVVVARRLDRPSRRLWWWALAAGVLWSAGALASIGLGDPRGLTQLLLPVTLLVLLGRRSTRDYVDREVPRQRAGRTRAPRRRAGGMSRLGGGIGAARESGQGVLEYVGVLAAAAVVMAVVGATLGSGQTQEEIRATVDEVVCTMTSGGPGCADGGGVDGGDDDGTGEDGSDPGQDARDQDREDCEGLWGCAWEVVKQVGSGLFNVVKGAWDDLVGIWELIKDPGALLDAIAYLIENPTELWKLIWDDETAAMWAAGDYGGAIGRLIWNVGSWFIPGVNLAKLVAKGGKFGKLADLAGELAGVRRLADDAATAADRTADAVRRGDADAAARAAEDARRAADDAAEKARQRGCPVAAGTAGPSGDGVLALGGERPVQAVAAVVVVQEVSHLLAGGTGCGDLTDAAREAQEAAELSGILRDASKGKGNFGLGQGTMAQAREAGQAWVGEGYTVASDGKTLVSADGLRQWRPPSYKPRQGGWQSNFEGRDVPSGQWQSNGHLDITDPP